MKRSIALLSLSFALASSAFADERGFARALEEWQALYRPLATARGQGLAEAVATVESQFSAREEAVSKSRDASVRDHFSRHQAAVQANVDAIEQGYAKVDVRGKRMFVRLVAVLSNVFGDTEAPRYSTCGTRSFTVDSWAGDAFRQWVEASPAAYLGLLDDPDARVAEAAVGVLAGNYREEVVRHLEAWRYHPQARFRGIAAAWLWKMGEEEGRAFLLRSLDDPSGDVRDLAVREMPYPDVQEAYRLRRPTFDSASEAQRRTILVLAGRLDEPEKGSLALACLEAKEASLLRVALDTLQYSLENVPVVPTPTLARLRKHPDRFIRMGAYSQSGRQSVPMRDLRAGMTDADSEVRSRAFTACVGVAETPEELRVVLEYGLNIGDSYWLPEAAHRLGERAVDAILPLLPASDASHRKLGVQMACRTASPRLQEVLEKRLTDADSEVRRALARECVYFPEPLARRWLKTLAADPNGEIRDAANASLKTLDRRMAADD